MRRLVPLGVFLGVLLIGQFALALPPCNSTCSGGCSLCTTQCCLGYDPLYPSNCIYVGTCANYDTVGCGDPDGDGLCSRDDNCDNTANPDQANCDGDSAGDACDSSNWIDLGWAYNTFAGYSPECSPVYKLYRQRVHTLWNCKTGQTIPQCTDLEGLSCTPDPVGAPVC